MEPATIVTAPIQPCDKNTHQLPHTKGLSLPYESWTNEVLIWREPCWWNWNRYVVLTCFNVFFYFYWNVTYWSATFRIDCVMWKWAIFSDWYRNLIGVGLGSLSNVFHKGWYCWADKIMSSRKIQAYLCIRPWNFENS